MQWNWLRVFYYVCKFKNFTRAAEQLNISQSAVSYTMNELEHALEKTLFKRLPRGIELTKDGLLLLEYVRNMQQESDNIKNNIFSRKRDQKQTLKGKIRIATTTAIAGKWLPSILSGFLKEYPEIKLDIFGSDESLDVRTRECDIAIRPKTSKISGTIQKHLFTLQLKLFASPDYIEQNPNVFNIKDLDKHKLISYGGKNYSSYKEINWLLYKGIKNDIEREPYLVVNSSEGAFKFAEKGHGIISYPDNIPGQNITTLKNVFPNCFGPEIDITCIYSERVKDWVPIMKVVDHLEKYCRGNINV